MQCPATTSNVSATVLGGEAHDSLLGNVPIVTHGAMILSGFGKWIFGCIQGSSDTFVGREIHIDSHLTQITQSPPGIDYVLPKMRDD